MEIRVACANVTLVLDPLLPLPLSFIMQIACLARLLVSSKQCGLEGKDARNAHRADRFVAPRAMRIRDTRTHIRAYVGVVNVNMRGSDYA